MEKENRPIPQWRPKRRLSGPSAKFMDRYIGSGCITFYWQKYTIQYGESDQNIVARVRHDTYSFDLNVP